jgi:hypothetical protein
MKNYRPSENVSSNDPQRKASFRRTVKKQMGECVSKWEQKKFIGNNSFIIFYYYCDCRIDIYHYQRFYSGTVRMELNNLGFTIVY